MSAEEADAAEVIVIRRGKKFTVGPKKHSFAVDVSFSGPIKASEAREALQDFLELIDFENTPTKTKRFVVALRVNHLAHAVSARRRREREEKELTAEQKRAKAVAQESLRQRVLTRRAVRRELAKKQQQKQQQKQQKQVQMQPGGDDDA